MEASAAPLPPRRFNAPELLRVGVEVVGAAPIRLACLHCGAQWHPRIDSDGRIEHRYWVCVECAVATG